MIKTLVTMYIGYRAGLWIVPVINRIAPRFVEEYKCAYVKANPTGSNYSRHTANQN